MDIGHFMIRAQVRRRLLALVHAADGRAVVDHRDLSRRIPRPLLGGTAVVPEGVRVWDAVKRVAQGPKTPKGEDAGLGVRVLPLRSDLRSCPNRNQTPRAVASLQLVGHNFGMRCGPHAPTSVHDDNDAICVHHLAGGIDARNRLMCPRLHHKRLLLDHLRRETELLPTLLVPPVLLASVRVKLRNGLPRVAIEPRPSRLA